MHYEITVQSNLEFPTLSECAIDDTDLPGGQADLQTNETAQVRLLLEHVLPDHLIIVVEPVDLVGKEIV
jgi:hypothetical protein